MRKNQDVFTIKNGRVKMRNGGYKTTEDAVLLAGVAKARGAVSVLDVGVGAGGVALAMLDDNPKLKVAALDISDEMLSRTWVNALLNERDVEMILADIMKWKTSRLFDVVVTNPPYSSGTPRKDNAHHNADIFGWISACAKRVRARGFLHAIVATDVLDKVIAALVASKFGGIELRMIGVGGKVSRVVVSARKGVATPLKIMNNE